MSRVVIMQPYYFAWYGFFEQIKLADIYVIYNDVQYIRRSLMNRVSIRTKNGDRWMTIPLKDVHQGDLINEIECDEEKEWRRNHLALLKQSYKDAPFCREMMEVAEEVYSLSNSTMQDVTSLAIKTVSKFLDLSNSTEFYRSSELNIKGKGSQRLLDITKSFKADVYLTGMGALNYLDYSLFEDNGVSVEFINYKKAKYPQLQNEFNPYVSILDLIANTGRSGSDFMKSNTLHYADFINTREAKEYLSKTIKE